MDKQKWLIAGLSLVMAASLGVGISACGGEQEHTHTYDAWDHSETQHWKYCDEHGNDKSNIDETTRANHDFSSGDCVCGAKKPGDVTPDADLDTREFYVVGGGMGDLATGTWSGPNANFKFTKAEEPDENGYTVYTYQMKLYSADEFKFIEKNTISQGTDADGNPATIWDAATTFMLADLDMTAAPDAFSGDDNIVVNMGKDGIYKFTLLTKKGGEAKENKMKVELVEPVEALDITAQYEMYIVGSVQSKPGSNWPSNFSNLADVQTKCYKLELQEDGRTFSVEVKLVTTDAFKVWNYKLGNKDAGYYPTGMGGDLKVSKDGYYVVSWKVGDARPTITEHEHKYTEWGHDIDGHWKQCPLDGAIGEETRGEHIFDPETHTCECGAVTTEACAHDGEINFNYTLETLPEQNAEGGTLKANCAKCGKEIDVPYDAILTYQELDMSQAVPPAVIENDKVYYGKVAFTVQSANYGAYMGYKIEKAGELTVSMDLILNRQTTGYNQTPTQYPWILKWMTISDTPLETGMNRIAFINSNAGTIVSGGKWNTNAGSADAVAKWKTQTVFDGAINDADYVPFHSMTLTFKEEDVGKCVYFTIGTQPMSNMNNASLLIDVRFTPASAEIIAPAEVAMLPGKKD